MICKEGGELSLLLGQDTGNLLLKPVSDIKGKQVSKYLPEIAKDLSLQLTPASDKYSICGAIGGGDPMETSCRLYKSSMKTGHFKFYSPSSPSDISVLRSQYSVATFSAQAGQLSQIAGPSYHPPGGGGEGGSRQGHGNNPGHPQTAAPHTAASSGDPSQQQVTKQQNGGVSRPPNVSYLENVKNVIKAAILHPKTKLPGFSTLAFWILNPSILSRSSENITNCSPSSSTDVS